MSSSSKVTTNHLRRSAYLYVRQSSLHQVRENRESTARQYDLKRRAQSLGWTTDQIVVIDEDLGLSGSSAVNRNGFQRLVAEVGLGRVGVVMGLEVSRLARNSTDWHRLLEICALSETLILDEDGIYDPGHFNDRLLLGMKGTMSEAELHILRARLLGGQLNKAERGELYMKPPIGYVYVPSQGLRFDPDEQIRRSVQLVFETFQRTGSAERVVKYFSTEKLLFPRRLVTGSRKGELIFASLEHSRVLSILHNPRYAGAYVYGRTRQRKVRLEGQFRYQRVPRNEWKIFLPNTHPGYISWEQFEANQTRLLENANGYGLDRRKSPAREGAALLQGLVLCGKCGGRMTIRYYVRRGHPVPDYVCQRRGVATAEPACQIVVGTGLDQAVGEKILECVTPASLDVALQVFEELRTRRDEMDRLRKAHVQRAREEAELAQRHYLAVRPENRLVADNLERIWNEKLLRLRQEEECYARTLTAEGTDIQPAVKEKILSLAGDLPRVWNDIRTPMREKKRMLRLLVDDVTLNRQGDRIAVQIRWKGGATTSFEQPTPKNAADLRRTPSAIVELIRALATEQTDKQIAHTLNTRDLRSGTGQRFTRRIVKMIRHLYKIPSLTDHLQQLGWLTAPEVSKLLGIHFATAKRFAQQGVLRAVRSDDGGQILFAPILGPLPKPHPGKRFKDRRFYSLLPAKGATDVMKGVQYAA